MRSRCCGYHHRFVPPFKLETLFFVNPPFRCSVVCTKLVAQMKQDPQDGELKRQLHDRRITALSDKQNQTLCKGLNELQNGQKLAVRSCPVGSTKPLSLIKPPSQGIAISVVPAKAPVSMVTAHINGQKAASSEPLQTSPINLQTGGRVAAAGVHPFSSRRAGELPPSQMLGTLTAVPIKVPQVSSLHRLAGQAATVLPQVRPKTQIPDSLPHSPCQELQPLSLQRATAVVSPKSQGPTLPTANSTFSPDHQPNGQSDASSPPAPPHGPSGAPDSGGPAQHASAGPGVAYAIIAASPATGNGVSAVSEAVKVQPLLFSADNKVIIIQPQAPSSTEGSPGAQADLPSQEAPPAPKSPSQKKDEDPEKIAFMVALGLVTTEHLEEIQTKRQERKRRSTANPAYSGLFEPERKRLASHYLNSSLFLSARDSEDFCWKEDLEHDDHCAVCKEDGELQPCHNCPRAFHPNCLHPPLKTPPRGPWYCPKCQKKVLNKENMSWPQNFVQSYVTHKTVRQEEKRRLLRRNNELKKECAHLEEQDKKLNDTLKCMDLRERLLGQQRDTQASLERLKALIRLIQRDQLIQVTMTTTATIAAASLLSQSWIKPTSTAAAAVVAAAAATAATAAAPGPSATPLQQKSHAHSQDDTNN
ncbi:PHD finger protein 21B isoform X2 [Epinephelus moara]|uniref:PHD finger protein 21B isoform X2 n=1 Tax=Epinephelus moara TaxID=300413 RepID=UPI00214E8CF0|nr:PHD finger protein 21B isoform X2 [Epinephelus moara]